MRLPIKLIRVVDGDTIQIMCRGLKETIRLHSVDTEESAIGYGKPATSVGIRAKHFTREMCHSGELLLELDYSPDQDIDVSLQRNRDTYGRLITHIYIDVGDSEPLHLNSELIKLGLSPYFNKYGNSRVYDAKMREAQNKAQRIDAMIWAQPGRDYDRLIPQWEHRAAGMDFARQNKVVIISEFCDNEWLSIREKSIRCRNFSQQKLSKGNQEKLFILDFQGGVQKSFRKGVVIHEKAKNNLRFFFSRSQFPEFSLIEQLIQRRDYGFVAGFYESYRGLTQINVNSVAMTPFDLISDSDRTL